ncbi:MAG: diacylglycerol kinase [Alphaproteobacteria bacterium]
MKKIYRAFLNSISGLKFAFKDERAFRQESFLAIVLISIACFLEVSSVERILLIFSVFFILIVELVNTAIEACIDRISKKIHPLSKKAKDVGSSAVLLSIILAIVIWSLILI